MDDNPQVYVASLCVDDVSPIISVSLRMIFDSFRGRSSIRAVGPGIIPTCSEKLAQARNDVVKRFLADKNSEWLFFVDSDLLLRDTLEQLIAVAHPQHRPVVGALCFGSAESGNNVQERAVDSRPSLYDSVAADEDKVSFDIRTTYPLNSVIQVGGTDASCLLIHRSILETTAELYGETWFNRLSEPNGTSFSEGLSFCVRASATGAPIFVHTGAKTARIKRCSFDEENYWSHFVPPPATEYVAVLVPVLDRPQNAEPFMLSLRASTGLANVYALCSNGDAETAKAWEDNGAEVLQPCLTTFPEKINFGYSRTKEPWVFLVGDDVRFYPGWLDHAQYIAGESNHVIGTNDLANPRVREGEHATHMLVRRSYVERVGASWDGPGIVCHEGYNHLCVDGEIVMAAKQRECWAMALGSIVEHLHPYVGKNPRDDVYERGNSAGLKDLTRFVKRITNNKLQCQVSQLAEK